MKLAHLARELIGSQRRAALLGQQIVHLHQIRCKLRWIDTIIHLRREQVRTVVPKAPLALKFHDGQRLYSRHTQVGEILNAIDGVQELRYPIRTDIVPPSIGGIKDTEVKLIHEASYDAVAVRIAEDL